MVKECKTHGSTEFVLRKDGKYRCKKCVVDAVQKRREKIKLMAIEYKGGKCQNTLCGYNKCVAALEFHHVIKEDKEFSISYNGHSRSWESVKKELDKCLLLCCNCHREVHAGLLDISYLDVSINIEVIVNKCIDCGKDINLGSIRCTNCYIKSKRKNIIKRIKPDKDILIKEVKEIGYSATGRKYGVSDNSIRKWIK